MQLAVVNHSRRASDAQLATIAAAVHTQCVRDFCPIWGMVPPTILAFPARRAPAGMPTVALLDAPDSDDVLGYHDDQNGRIIGFVFANPVLDNGGTIFGNPGHPDEPCLASVFGHEITEIVTDASCNAWHDCGREITLNGETFSEVARESADAVEGDGYTILVGRQPVVVSNFVTSAFFDPQAPAGTKRDFLGKLRDAFTFDAGGYLIVRDGAGQVKKVFGEAMPEWKRECKRTSGRGACRMPQSRISGVVAVTG